MKKVVTATSAVALNSGAEVRLTLPPDSRVRVGSPFYENMSAIFVSPDPKAKDRVLVMVDGSQVTWPKANVHARA